MPWSRLMLGTRTTRALFALVAVLLAVAGLPNAATYAENAGFALQFEVL